MNALDAERATRIQLIFRKRQPLSAEDLGFIKSFPRAFVFRCDGFDIYGSDIDLLNMSDDDLDAWIASVRKARADLRRMFPHVLQEQTKNKD